MTGCGSGAVPTPEELRAFYGHFWSTQDRPNRWELDRATAILREILRLGLREPRICELGCGRAVLTAALDLLAGPTTGIDIAIGAARERFPELALLEADLSRSTAEELGAASFDVVVSSEVLEHMTDHDRHFALVVGLLKPGGHLILTTPNLDAVTDRTRWSNQPVENWTGRRGLRTLCARHGLRCERLYCLGVDGDRGLNRIAHSTKLRRLFGTRWDAAWLWAGYGLHLVCVARKHALEL